MTVIEYGPDKPLKTAREARIWSEAQAEMRERCAKEVEKYIEATGNGEALLARIRALR